METGCPAGAGGWEELLTAIVSSTAPSRAKERNILAFPLPLVPPSGQTQQEAN